MWSEVFALDGGKERCVLKTTCNCGESVLFPTQNTHIEYDPRTATYTLRTSFLLNSVHFYSSDWNSAKQYASGVLKNQFLILRTRLEASGIL